MRLLATVTFCFAVLIQPAWAAEKARAAEEIEEAVILNGQTGGVRVLAFSPDGKTLASGGGKFGKEKGLVKFWDVESWKAKDGYAYTHDNSITSVAFSRDGTKFASSSAAEFLRPAALILLDYDPRKSSGEIVHPTLSGEAFHITCVAFSPDGKTLASGNETAGVKLWNTAKRQEVHKLEHPGGVLAVAFSPDGKTVASACDDETIRFWDVATGKAGKSIKEKNVQVKAIAFSKDGTTLAAGGGTYDEHTKKWLSGEIKLWNVASTKLETTLTGHENAVIAMALAADGKLLVSAVNRKAKEGNQITGELRLWDMPNGKLTVSVKSPAGINSLAISPDGKFLAVAGYDEAIRIWEIGKLTAGKDVAK